MVLDLTGFFFLMVYFLWICIWLIRTSSSLFRVMFFDEVCFSLFQQLCSPFWFLWSILVYFVYSNMLFTLCYNCCVYIICAWEITSMSITFHVLQTQKKIIFVCSTIWQQLTQFEHLCVIGAIMLICIVIIPSYCIDCSFVMRIQQLVWWGASLVLLRIHSVLVP